MNVRKILRNSLRLYFAPLTGAYQAVVAEMRRMERESVEHFCRNKPD